MRCQKFWRRSNGARKRLAMAAKANCIRTACKTLSLPFFCWCRGGGHRCMLNHLVLKFTREIFSFQSRLLLLHSFNFFFSSTSHTCLRANYLDLRNWVNPKRLSQNACFSYQITCHKVILSSPRQMAINYWGAERISRVCRFLLPTAFFTTENHFAAKFCISSLLEE